MEFIKEFIDKIINGFINISTFVDEFQDDNIIDEFKPGVVINTAAIADVDLCEEEKEVCWNTNVTAIGYLIDACKRHDTHLIHISTDYIFNGEKDNSQSI